MPARNRAGRPVPPFDADSLAHLKACELIDDAPLARIPGALLEHAGTEFADWACDWDQSAAEVNGHEVRLDPEDEGAGTCVARVVRRDRGGRPLVELVHLALDGDQPVDRLCATTSAMAASIAGKLPG